MLIRSIKPEFWSDEKVVSVSLTARLFFLALLNYVDNAGRCWWQPTTMRLRLFPADDLDLAALGVELAQAGLVALYRSPDGKACLQVVNFTRHQRIDPRYKASQVPSEAEGYPLDSAGTHGSPAEHREPNGGVEGSGVEGSGGEGCARSPGTDVENPPSPRARTIQTMQSLQLDTNERAVDEWIALIREAKPKSVEEGCAFLAFAVRQKRDLGREVAYARHAVEMPAAWRQWARERYWKGAEGG